MNTDPYNEKYVIRMKDSLTRRWKFLDITTGEWIFNPLILEVFLSAAIAKQVVERVKSKGFTDQEAVSLDRAIHELQKV